MKNHDNPGGTKRASASKLKNHDTPKGDVTKREGPGGIGSNRFTGSKGVASQKSYGSAKPLRDGTGAKGSKGK